LDAYTAQEKQLSSDSLRILLTREWFQGRRRRSGQRRIRRLNGSEGVSTYTNDGKLYIAACVWRRDALCCARSSRDCQSLVCTRATTVICHDSKEAHRVVGAGRARWNRLHYARSGGRGDHHSQSADPLLKWRKRYEVRAIGRMLYSEDVGPAGLSQLVGDRFISTVARNVRTMGRGRYCRRVCG